MATSTRDAGTVDLPQLVDLIPPLRRFVGSLVRDSHDVEDIVQETLARVIPARERLDELSLSGYAITVARNLVHDLHRGAARRRRLLPRLIEDRPPEQPEASAIALEERRALRAALDQLPSDQRELMLAHDLHGDPLSGGEFGASSGAAAARLARTRARLRVDYVLALRGVELPTTRCRPVLQSMSAGDRRRQGVLRAGHHLLNCPTCAAVAPVLLRRDRALAGLIPWWSPAGGVVALVAAARRKPVHFGVTTAAVAASAAVAVAIWPSTSAPNPSTSTADLVVAGRALLPERDRLAEFAGRTAVARAVPVLSVPADEGFWVGHGKRRVWVQLSGPGESRVHVRRGDRVTFTGKVVRNGSQFGRRVGIGEREGAADLHRQRYHLKVDRSDLHAAS